MSEPTPEAVTDGIIEYHMLRNWYGLRPMLIAAIRAAEQRGREQAVVWADDASPFSGPQVLNLLKENERLRLRVLTAAGDDLCRLTQEEIKEFSSGAVKIPPEEEFIPSCKRFHAQIANASGVLENSLTLAQMIAENERLREDKQCGRLSGWEEAREACKEVANVEAKKCARARVVQGDLQRNYFGGGLRSSEEIKDAIAALTPPTKGTARCE